MKTNGIKVEITDVGDRYVIERMREGDFNIGGEQSGHIIFMDYATTGDGIISALHVLKLMTSSGKKLSELANFMTVFPQKITSLPVSRKLPLSELPLLSSVIRECETDLGESGRTIVRFSGTENKIRILVEAEAPSAVERWTKRITEAAQSELC